MKRVEMIISNASIRTQFENRYFFLYETCWNDNIISIWGINRDCSNSQSCSLYSVFRHRNCGSVLQIRRQVFPMRRKADSNVQAAQDVKIAASPSRKWKCEILCSSGRYVSESKRAPSPQGETHCGHCEESREFWTWDSNTWSQAPELSYESVRWCFTYAFLSAKRWEGRSWTKFWRIAPPSRTL